MCFCREVLLGEFGDSKRIANNSSAWGFCNCVWMWRADVIPAEQKAAAAAWGCLTCHLAQREIGWPGSSFFILFFTKLFNSVCLNCGGTNCYIRLWFLLWLIYRGAVGNCGHFEWRIDLPEWLLHDSLCWHLSMNEVEVKLSELTHGGEETYRRKMVDRDGRRAIWLIGRHKFESWWKHTHLLPTVIFVFTRAFLPFV